MFYNMSKAALNHYSKDAAIKYAPKGIRVNIVRYHRGPSPSVILVLRSFSPGPTESELVSRHTSKEAVDAFMKSMEKITLVDRMGRPEDVAAVIRMLCSDDSSFITGAEMIVDGGFLINPRS